MLLPVSRLTIKQMEMEWTEYHNSIKEIEQQKKNMPGDVDKARLRYLKVITEAISCIYDNLDDMKRVLIQQRYWGPKKRGWMLTAARCYIDRRTAMRWRDEIMIETARNIGAR